MKTLWKRKIGLSFGRLVPKTLPGCFELGPVAHGRVITPAQQLLNKRLPILGISSLFKYHVESRHIEGESVIVVVAKMWLLKLFGPKLLGTKGKCTKNARNINTLRLNMKI